VCPPVPQALQTGKEPFGDSGKNGGARSRDGIMKVLQVRGRWGHQHASGRSRSDQRIPSTAVPDVGIESKAALWI